MKKIILIFTLLLPLTTFGQEQTLTNDYVQLSSIYFQKESTKINVGQRQMIWDQGRYFTFTNTISKIVFKVFCTSNEYNSCGGDKLLLKRVRTIKNILIKDCNVDSTRFITILIGDKIRTNNNPSANRRVDIEILKLK